MSWTTTKIRRLKQLKEDGVSVKHMARILECTPDAVQSQVFKLGLCKVHGYHGKGKYYIGLGPLLPIAKRNAAARNLTLSAYIRLLIKEADTHQQP